MKPTTLLLTASLIANGVLLAAFALRSSSPSATPGPSSPPRSSPPASSADKSAALQAALASGDAAALKAAGLSADVARDVALGRAFSRIAENARAAEGKNATNPRWWQKNGNAAGSREQQMATRRAVSDALISAFGHDFGLSGADAGQFGFLPPDKAEALRRIVQDYDEMMAKFSTGGIQLASDKEKLRLLKAERDRDIAALLTPDERLAYEMRTSPTAASVRNRYGDAIQTEEDFAKIYALQKAFDDKFSLDGLNGKVTPELMKQRADAQRQLQDDVRAALGDEKYAALRRATDGDLRNIDSLVSRLNLPPTTTQQIASARESFAAESQRINADAALTAPQRRAQIQDLGNRAKADLVRTLGNEAAEAYAQSSPWVSMLQSGVAYSTTPQANSPGSLMLSGGAGSPSIFPVLPAGANAGGVARQVITSGSGPNADGTRTVDHVMTFSTSVGDGGTAVPMTKQMIIVAPPPSEPAPAAPPKP